MTYNNESGIYTDVKKFRKLFGDKTIIHSDITQMLGKVQTDLKDIDADYYTFSGHKFHSPKGVGGLIVRKGKKILPLFIGGGQENSIRPGTTDVASVYSMYKALEESTNLLSITINMQSLRDKFEELVLSQISGTKILGKEYHRLPNTSYLSISGINSDILVSNLDGLTIGNGSACNSYSHEVSHVAKEMSNTEIEARSVIRVSLSRFNTISEVITAVDMLVREVNYIRTVGL
jgi:cysteine desulfurase